MEFPEATGKVGEREESVSSVSTGSFVGREIETQSDSEWLE